MAVSCLALAFPTVGYLSAIRSSYWLSVYSAIVYQGMAIGYPAISIGYLYWLSGYLY